MEKIGYSLSEKISMGTSNPIYARISVGLSEILDLTEIPSDDKKEIKNYLFDLSKYLIYARIYASRVLREHEEIEKLCSQLSAEEFLKKNQGLPSLRSLDDVNHFLYYSKKVLRIVGAIMGIIFGRHKDQRDKSEFDGVYRKLVACLDEENLDKKIRDRLLESAKRILENNSGNSFGEYRDGKFDKIIKDLNKMFPDQDTTLIKILELHHPRIRKLSTLRDSGEHPENSDDLLINYRPNEQEHCRIDAPYFKDEEGGTNIYQFLSECLKWDLLFCEEVILFSMLECLPEDFELKEIEESKRQPQCPKRFKVTLLGME